eukprot:g18543.t1
MSRISLRAGGLFRASAARFGKGVGGGPGEHCFAGNRDTLFHYKRVRLSESHQLPLQTLPQAPSGTSVFDNKGGNGRLPHVAPTDRTLEFTKFPGVVSKLGAEYFFREKQERSEQTTYYHMKTKSGTDVVFVGSVDARKRETRTVENFLHEKTRGFAVQLILEGRGVKVYYEGGWPNLCGRKGVGDKARDLSYFAKLDSEVNIEVNKVGNLCVVSGPTKAQVGNVAIRLFWKLKQGVYSGKGAKIAFNWVKRKTRNKK